MQGGVFLFFWPVETARYKPTNDTWGKSIRGGTLNE
jgi:hypothetical protein